MNRLLPLLLLPTMALATVRAQNVQDLAVHDVNLQAILLVHYGPGDLVLNAALLGAMTAEPACDEALKKTLGGALAKVNGFGVQLPVAHAPGTCQIHLSGRIAARGSWSDTQRDAAIDAVIAHLEHRLDALLYEDPMGQLTQQRHELSQQHAELLTRRARLQAQTTATATRVDSLTQRLAAAESQMLAARVDVATERRSQEQLEKLRQQYEAHRAAHQEFVNKLARESAGIERQLREANESLLRLNEKPQVTDTAVREQLELTRQLRELQDKRDALAAQGNQSDLPGHDAERMLTVVLEQVPTTFLALQRAEARLQSLEEEGTGLRDMLAKAEAEQHDAIGQQADTERLDIDLTVCRSLLTEVQGKLGRLQPVKYELLRQR